MNHNYIISSNNIVLTPIGGDDLELMRKWRNDQQNRESFLSNNYINKEQQQIWYQKYLNTTNDVMFLINDTESDLLKIGIVGLYNINTHNKSAEFGRLLIGEPFARGRGLGFFATYALCEFGFTNFGLNRIYLEVLRNNTTAYRTYINVGFLPNEHYYKNEKEIIKMILYKENFNGLN